MRLIRFIYRLKNQYRIHHRWASVWMIVKIAWIQAGRKKAIRYDGEGQESRIR